MFYPLQIPNILDEEFNKSIIYEEYLNNDLKNHIMCIWSMKSIDCLKQPINNMILPDACVDLVIDFTKKMITFSAMSTATFNLPLTEDVDYIGIRFRPGIFYNIYNTSCSVIMDNNIYYKH